MSAADKRVTAVDVYNAMKVRYAAPAWALFAEVRNGTGFSRAVRTCDALAMSLWPSRGLDLHGFEIKVSRHDWQTELKKPDKAEAIAQYCDFWWLCIAEESIVQPGELPPTWGLLVMKGRKLVARTEPTRLSPKPLDRLMLASIFRNAAEGMIPKASIQAEIDEAVKGATAGMAGAASRLERRFKELGAKINEFERISGISIMYGSHEDWKLLGKIRCPNERRNLRQDLQKLLHSHQIHMKQLQDAVDALNAFDEASTLKQLNELPST